MTALKPMENRRVRAVPAEKYPLNAISSHPTSDAPAVDPHHIFPRSAIGGDSWFVEITDDDGTTIIPHVTGLSREEHELVEAHHAWIKYEDGEFVWYDRCIGLDVVGAVGANDSWERVGPLDPQPGGREKVHRPKRKRLKGDDLAKRKTISVRLPEGVDGVYWEELLGEAEQIELDQPDTKFNPDVGGVPVGKLIVAVFERFTGRV
jgi:hypothetical protein